MEKERITFLDYVRVFACFLVILVHASENYYGAPDATDMVGPTSYLANEADRLWVSVYDGFSRMSVPLFMIVSAFPVQYAYTKLYQISANSTSSFATDSLYIPRRTKRKTTVRRLWFWSC